MKVGKAARSHALTRNSFLPIITIPKGDFLSKMVETTEVHQRVLLALRSWEGFDAFDPVFQELQEVDIYLAGGALRDPLLGQEHGTKDFDFFLGGKEEDIDRALTRLAECGIMRTGPFGSPRWFSYSGKENYCDIIPIKRFFNGLWRCEDIVDVLNQFDFTSNAVALNLRSGQFYDPQNGLRDLLRRIMRAVRFDYPDEPILPEQTITRPAVVWFRILHYAATLNLAIEPITRSWLERNKQFAEQGHAFSNTFFELHPRALALAGCGQNA